VTPPFIVQIMFSGSSEAVPTRFMQTGEHAPYERLLRVGASRGLPMVCCNPDIKTVLAGGSVGHMPGAIATAYEEMGGTVLWHAPVWAPARAADSGCRIE
jgi:hypothetical protein